MIRLFFKIALLIPLLTVGLCNCVDLKHVSDFSSSSLESIRKFEEIGYSFKQNCLDDCRDKKINDLDMISQECNCKANEMADSVNLLIYNAVKGYLDGLTNLSNNNRTNYKLDALTKALTDIDLSSVRIEKAQIEAYSKISGILLRALTDKYRRHKIKEYVKSGNEPFNVLISFLDFNLSANLAGKLKVQKLGILDYYFDLTKEIKLSTFEKRKAAEEYYRRLDNIEDKQNELRTYSKVLKKIAIGHQKLADNIDSISKDEIKRQLIQFASDIKDLISEFNKISKS